MHNSGNVPPGTIADLGENGSLVMDLECSVYVCPPTHSMGVL